MKVLFLLLVLVCNAAYSKDTSTLTLEERVAALEKTVNEPIVLQECDLVPAKIKEGWLPIISSETGSSEYPLKKEIYVPYQSKQQILVDSKIYTRLLNKFFIMYLNFTQSEASSTPEMILIANKYLKLMRDGHQLCANNQ